MTLNGTVQRKQGKIVRYITAIQDLTAIVEEQQRAKLEIREKLALINSTRDIVWSVDKEGNLVSFNDAFEDLIKTFQGKLVKRGDPGAIEASDDFELTNVGKATIKKPVQKVDTTW